jgi:hypothetical protein
MLAGRELACFPDGLKFLESFAEQKTQFASKQTKAAYVGQSGKSLNGIDVDLRGPPAIWVPSLAAPGTLIG